MIRVPVCECVVLLLVLFTSPLSLALLHVNEAFDVVGTVVE